MVTFSIYAYYQLYLLIEGVLNFDFDFIDDQTCNVFCTRLVSLIIIPLILFSLLLYQRRFVSFTVIWFVSLPHGTFSLFEFQRNQSPVVVLVLPLWCVIVCHMVKLVHIQKKIPLLKLDELYIKLTLIAYYLPYFPKSFKQIFNRKLFSLLLNDYLSPYLS